MATTHSYRQSIKHWLNKKESPEDVAARVFEVYPARIFEKQYGFDDEFEIKRRIAIHIGTGLNNILFCGSAHVGESLHANTPFNARSSDLDVAIIDGEKFIELGNLVQQLTNDLQNLNKFPVLGKIQDVPQFFKNNYSNGYIHTFTIPSCDHKRYIDDFFRELESDYRTKFSSISASFYSSLMSFERKQKISFQFA